MPVDKIAITLDRELVKEIDRGVKSGLYRNRAAPSKRQSGKSSIGTDATDSPSKPRSSIATRSAPWRRKE